MQQLKIVLVTALLLNSAELRAQVPNWDLLTHSTGANNEYMNVTTTSSQGNVYYSGTAQGAYSFNGVPVKYYPNMASNAYLGHYSSSGTHNWTISIGGNKTSFAFAEGITTDPSGNVFFRVTSFGGVVGDTVFIGPNYFKRLTNAESLSLIVKMDSLGNVLWTNEINPNATTQGILSNVKMTADSNGDLNITGWFFGPQKFDNFTINPIGPFDAMFLAKCSSTGSFLWVKAFGCDGNDGQTFEMTRNNQNDIFISGGWEGDTLFIDGQYLINPTPGGFFNTDRFIAKFNSSGILQWLKREGSLDSDDISKLVVMNNGDLICQSLMGANNVTVNGNQIIPGGAANLITKYNAQGNFLSYYKTPLPISALSTDGKSLYMGITFDTPTLTYGNITINNAGGLLGTTDIAIIKMDTQYNAIWAVNLGSDETEYISSISYSTAKGLVIGANTTSSQLTVGSSTINNSGLLTNEGILLGLDIIKVGISTTSMADNIKCFPNPATDAIYLNFEEELSSKIEVKILNTSAKVLMDETYNYTKQIPINISELSKGIYILEIKVGNKYSVKKIIKE